MRSSLHYALPIVLGVAPAVLFGQWLGYPTGGVPRTPDGTPNLAAPVPRSADGKPDFSGMWGWVNIGPPCGGQCTDTQISREFINIASTLKNPLPYRPWAAELVKKRTVEQGLDPNVHCMPRGAPRIWTDDYYKQIFQVPGRVIILTERIDGRGKNDRKNPAADVRNSGNRDYDQRSEGLYRTLDCEAERASGARQRTHRLLLPGERTRPGAYAAAGSDLDSAVASAHHRPLPSGKSSGVKEGSTQPPWNMRSAISMAPPAVNGWRPTVSGDIHPPPFRA